MACGSAAHLSGRCLRRSRYPRRAALVARASRPGPALFVPALQGLRSADPPCRGKNLVLRRTSMRNRRSGCRPRRWRRPRRAGRCPGHVEGSEEIGVHLRTELRRCQFLEEPGLKVACIVQQYVDSTEMCERCVDGCCRGPLVSDVQRYSEEPLTVADCNANTLGVASGGNDELAGRQGGTGELCAQAAAGAGDEPHLRIGHDRALSKSGVDGCPRGGIGEQRPQAAGDDPERSKIAFCRAARRCR